MEGKSTNKLMTLDMETMKKAEESMPVATPSELGMIKINNNMDRNNARSGKVNDFVGITQQMVSLYEKKNHDYGDSFGETFRKLGPISAITRITDKYNRLVSLATKGEQQVNDEKLEDTLIDLANYAVMTIMEIRNQEKNIISDNIEKPE